jgi:FkbM family methyltransferase
MRQKLRTAIGVLRSLRIYYGHPARARAMDRLYSQFILPGDLVIDVGAHVGDRVAAFRRLGAHVVAVEPQPAMHCLLKMLFGRDRRVTLVAAAVGRRSGTAEMKINPDNPTLSTLSEPFIAAAREAAGWQGESWPTSREVPLTTLDALIEAHGAPAFVKLDIEGFEAEALCGLSRAVPALSFEFTTIQRAVGLACIERCAALGYTQFNAALGESQALGEWRTAAALAGWLVGLPHAANSGDVYARRPVGPPQRPEEAIAMRLGPAKLATWPRPEAQETADERYRRQVRYHRQAEDRAAAPLQGDPAQ